MKNFIFIFCLIIVLFVTGCTSDNTQKNVSNSSKCDQNLLTQFAANEEDLLSTHEATGVILGYAEYANQYVVKVDRNLWLSTTPEQRILIRCATETVANKKGETGVVLDPNTNEKLN